MLSLTSGVDWAGSGFKHQPAIGWDRGRTCFSSPAHRPPSLGGSRVRTVPVLTSNERTAAMEPHARPSASLPLLLLLALCLALGAYGECLRFCYYVKVQFKEFPTDEPAS